MNYLCIQIQFNIVRRPKSITVYIVAIDLFVLLMCIVIILMLINNYSEDSVLLYFIKRKTGKAKL